MATATLNLNIPPRRMLNEAEAANYLRLPRKNLADCPVKPVELARGILRWDTRDLDAWIDTLKAGSPDSDDALIARLG